MSDADPPPPAPTPAPSDAPAPTPAPTPAPAPAPTASPAPTAASPAGPSEIVPTPPTPPPAQPTPSASSVVAPTSASPPAPAAPVAAPYIAPVAATAAAQAHYGPPPAVHHLSSAPTPYRPSTLPQQLKRLAYIVSIVLGGGAVLAGVWSAFLLPLLHATFSARTAIAAAQRDRWRGIVERLREIRVTNIFREPKEEEPEEEGALVRTRTQESKEEKDSEKSKDKDKALEKVDKEEKEEEEPEEEKEPGPIRLFGDVSPLSAALRDLTSSLDATATTRTSLVSTLETYTSGLHRELFLSRGGTHSTPWGPVPGANSSTSRVGLSTLSANLAKAGGSTSEASASPLGLPPAKSEEWDNVRREVRAIKGLLLNRRNFSIPSRTAVGAQ